MVAQITPSLTLIARYVRAARQKDQPLPRRIDGRFAATVLVALAALVAVLPLVSITPRAASRPIATSLAQNQNGSPGTR